jgi:hypothetical protein
MDRAALIIVPMIPFPASVILPTHNQVPRPTRDAASVETQAQLERWGAARFKRFQVLTEAQRGRRERCLVLAHGRDAVSARTVKELSELIGEIRGVQRRHIAALDARVKELEQRPTLKYHGVWKPGEYLAGSAVTKAGSLWIALSDTTAQPG